MFLRRKKAVLIGLVTALAVAGLTSGCHLFDEEVEDVDLDLTIETEPAETETETETEPETEAETETETESQTNVVYISEDGTVRIILPDTTWEVTQDIDEMRVFTSGSDAMINIVHASDAEEMQNISVMESRDELMESLVSQYPEEDAFEIMSFEERSSSTIQIYEYVVKYTYSTSMWSYSVTYGILATGEEAAYVVSGTVTDDDEKLLEAVQTSVESFSVLDQTSVFSVLPGIVKNNDSDSGSDEEEELADLTEYASPVTLYASSDVNIRENPSTNAEILDALAAGASVTVTGETKDWFRVNAGGTVGYINKAFLVYSSQTETNAAQSETTAAAADTTYGTSYTYYTSADVNLRSTPSSDGSIAGSLASGSAVTVIGESGDWYMVSVGGTTCYVYKSYVTSQQPENVTVDGTQTDAAPTDGGETAEPTQEETDAGSTTYSSSSTGMLQGTVTAVSGTTIALQDSAGNTYYIDYDNAGSVEVGSTVSATVDYAQTTDNGALYATSVN